VKVRVFQLARELKISSEALVNIITSLGEEVKGHMSSVEDDLVVRIRGKIAEERAAVKRETEKKAHIHEEIQKHAEEAKPRPVPPPPPAIVRPAPPPPPPVTRPSKPAFTPAPAPFRPARPAPSAPTPRPQPASQGASPAPAPSFAGAGARSFPRRAPEKGKKKKRQVDEQLVRENVRRTLATMDASRHRSRRRRRAEGTGEIEESKQLRIHEFATVAELASIMEVKPTEVIATCLSLGILANINRRLDKDAITAIMDEFGYEPDFIQEYGAEILAAQDLEEKIEEYENVPRAPIVTVMGHVDHGKTSLLDYIRKTKVIESESGGITQHIGAYAVRLAQGKITFLDTPGHEAFTAMRARGAQVTDIVVLVVAADDRVMPQTIEAINHARAAAVPIIVAINKIDLPAANPDRIRKELADHGVLAEEWGGKTVAVEIAAKFGTNVDKLLEMILLEASLLELKAQPERRAKGVVIESRREAGRGIAATVLIQDGTTEVGQPFVCGSQYGKVRAMYDERRSKVKSAGPATPVEILGWSGVPAAGDVFTVVKSEVEARSIAGRRSQIAREHEHRLSRQATSLISIQDRIKRGELHELNLVIKADVAGSIEVLRDSLQKLSTDEVKVRIIHTGVGLINESDILLALASGAIVIGFHTRPDARAHQAALNEEVDVRLYQVIYEVEKDVKDAMSGLLSPEKVEKISGSAEVRRVFHVTKVGSVAGCFVVSGTVHRSDMARVYRGADVVWSGRFGSLKRIKDDAREVTTGFECGIALDGFNEIREGDVIEAYTVDEVARRID
jgi:translation initiation factor IF-2